MASNPGMFNFEHLGIAEALLRKPLAVPLNQREYSWTEKEVGELLEDLHQAINEDKSEYFLGTVVTTRPATSALEVVDGQQRLATCTILLAAIRDYFFSKNDSMMIEAIEDFLFTIDRDRRERVPRLTLNVDDDKFFRDSVLPKPNEKIRKKATAVKASHERIAAASRVAAEHVENILRPFNESVRSDYLNKWVNFLQHKARIIFLTASDNANAYVMFETLNDRGLRTTQADLVKNYLFSQADTRINEAQERWSRMRGLLESLGEEVTLTYLRHLSISKYGYLKEREVFDRISSSVRGRTAAIDFLETLSVCAGDYVAILSPEHPKWNGYPDGMRSSVKTLNFLGLYPLRPLMLAVAGNFSSQNVATSFRLFVSWSVRFLIAGGGRSGSVEKALASCARDVTQGTIKNVEGMLKALDDVIPSDGDFQEAFSTKRVSSTALARYYLRAMELYRKGDAQPEWVPNEEIIINLEHVYPDKPTPEDWPLFEPETGPAYLKRIGNMALLQASKNSEIGNQGPSVKWKQYESSTFLFTKDVASYGEWGPKQIEDRQRDMSEYAVKTWPRQR